MHTPAHSIEHYIHAKDGNRPDLLRHCFTPDASLEMTVRTATIAFPAQASGRAAIADILVRNFALTPVRTATDSRRSLCAAHRWP